MPIAYSYLRFSSPQQSAGDSIRRQTESRERWLASHPKVKLDASLAMTDAGRSAFKRKDWDTYALKQFVDHIESGHVKAGSYLLVENLDRLSRDHAGDAVELFLRIVNRGIIVVQLSPVVIEFKRPVDSMQLMFAIVELSRGHSESAIKSKRGLAFWAKKQAEAHKQVVTKKLPGWIKYVDGKLVLDPEGARAVRQIFAMAIEGHGIVRIALKLNEEGVPVIGRKSLVIRGQSHLPVAKRKRRAIGWSGATVLHIIRSRATIGEYIPYRNRKNETPRPGIAGYFPRVVDDETFHRAASAIATRARVGRGRRGNHINIFSGLLRNALDGGTLTYWHTGLYPPTIIPVSYKDGKTRDWSCFPSEVFEEAILQQLREVKAADIASGGPNDAARKVEALSGRVAELDSLVKAWTAKMDNPNTVDIVAAKLAELNVKRKHAAEELNQAQVAASGPLAQSWTEFCSLPPMLTKSPDELKERVRAAIRRTIESVYCVFTKRDSRRIAAVQVNFVGGAGRRNYLVYSRRSFNNTPARWAVRSVKHPDDRLPFMKEDLRDRDDAEAVKAFLESYPTELFDRVVRGEPLASAEEIREGAKRAKRILKAKRR